MRTFLSVLLGFFFVIGVLVFVPVEGFFNELTDTESFRATVEDGGLYELSIEWTAGHILRDKNIKRLEGSPLECKRMEIVSVLKETFPEDWFLDEIERIHGDGVKILSTGKEPDRPIGLNITERRTVLADRTMDLLKQKIENLPVCTAPDVMKMARSNFDIATLNCRPDDENLGKVLVTLRSSISPMADGLPEFLELPGFYPKSLKSGLMIELRRAYRILVALSTTAYFILFTLLGLLFFVNWADRPKALMRTGIALLVAGLLLFIFTFPVHWISTNFLDMPHLARQFEVEMAGSPFGHDLMKAEIRLATAFLSSYFMQVAKMAAFIAVAGVMLIIGARVVRDDAPVNA